MRKDKGTPKHTFIVSNEKNPRVTLKPGQRLQVVTVSLAGPDLKKPSKVAARLCGGTSTCLSLVDIPREEAP